MIVVLGLLVLIAFIFVIPMACEILDIDIHNRSSLPGYIMSSKEQKEWEEKYITRRDIAKEQIKNKMSTENYNKFSNRFTIKANIAYAFIEDNITKDTYSPTTSIGLDETLNIIKIKLRKETIEELL